VTITTLALLTNAILQVDASTPMLYVPPMLATVPLAPKQQEDALTPQRFATTTICARPILATMPLDAHSLLFLVGIPINARSGLALLLVVVPTPTKVVMIATLALSIAAIPPADARMYPTHVMIAMLALLILALLPLQVVANILPQYVTTATRAPRTLATKYKAVCTLQFLARTPVLAQTTSVILFSVADI